MERLKPQIETAESARAGVVGSDAVVDSTTGALYACLRDLCLELESAANFTNRINARTPQTQATAQK